MSVWTFTSFDSFNSFPALWANLICSEEKIQTTRTFESGGPVGGRQGPLRFPSHCSSADGWEYFPQKVFSFLTPSGQPSFIMAGTEQVWSTARSTIGRGAESNAKLTQRKVACVLERATTLPGSM